MKTNNKKVEEKFYGKRVVKGIFAKAKFSHLSTMLDMLDYQSANDQEDLARKNIKGLAQSIGKLNPTKDEYSRYVKIAKSLGFTESQISGFARTGSKAKFAASKFEVGSTYEMRWDGQNFSHWKVLSRTTSTITIEDVANRFTNPASDDANMRSKGVVVPQKGSTVRVKIHTNGDEEFCFPMGRYSMAPVLNASKKVFARQGSKAKFANEEIAKGLSKVLKANGFNAMASEVLSGSTDSETLRKYIRALKSKMSPMSGNDRGMVLLQTLEKQLASRMGVKAKFANGGTKTASFLAKIDNKSKAMILENIAKNYGITAQAALAEVTDSEAENLLDYMTEPARSAASVLMQKYGTFSRTGAKAKFAFNLTKKVTYLNSDNYPQTYKVTDSLFAKLNLRDGNDRKYLEAALKTGEAVKISRKEAIS
jgi:nucleoid DNA-binding protein